VFIGGPGLLLQEEPGLVAQGARRDAGRIKGRDDAAHPIRLLSIHDAGCEVAGLLPRDPQLGIGHRARRKPASTTKNRAAIPYKQIYSE
jgi:hypothetical protein